MVASSFLDVWFKLFNGKRSCTAAKNAVASGTAVLIKNEDNYDSSYSVEKVLL